jgi:hemoglobin
VRRLALWFYEIMDSDPGASHIRTMHERNLAPIRQLLFEFLSGWLGGAPLYFQATRAPLPHVGTSSL